MAKKKPAKKAAKKTTAKKAAKKTTAKKAAKKTAAKKAAKKTAAKKPAKKPAKKKTAKKKTAKKKTAKKKPTGTTEALASHGEELEALQADLEEAQQRIAQLERERSAADTGWKEAANRVAEL